MVPDEPQNLTRTLTAEQFPGRRRSERKDICTLDNPEEAYPTPTCREVTPKMSCMNVLCAGSDGQCSAVFLTSSRPLAVSGKALTRAIAPEYNRAGREDLGRALMNAGAWESRPPRTG